MSDHIYDHQQHAEAEAIRRTLIGIGIPTAADVFAHLRWNPANSWFALSVPPTSLMGPPPRGAPGDIDVLGGPLEAASGAAWEACQARVDELSAIPRGALAHRELTWMACLEERRLLWPPDLDKMSAAEFKVSRFAATGDFRTKHHRTKKQSHARSQARGLCAIGFKRVALVHVLGGEQQPATAGHPWLVGGAAANEAGTRFADRVDASAADPFATIVLPLGAVPGSREDYAGATGAPTIYNEHAVNPRAASNANLSQVKVKLTAVFEKYPFDGRMPPVVLLACNRRSCAEIYIPPPGTLTEPCPECGGASTFSLQLPPGAP